MSERRSEGVREGVSEDVRSKRMKGGKEEGERVRSE